MFKQAQLFLFVNLIIVSAPLYSMMDKSFTPSIYPEHNTVEIRTPSAGYLQPDFRNNLSSEYNQQMPSAPFVSFNKIKTKSIDPASGLLVPEVKIKSNTITTFEDIISCLTKYKTKIRPKSLIINCPLSTMEKKNWDYFFQQLPKVLPAVENLFFKKTNIATLPVGSLENIPIQIKLIDGSGFADSAAVSPLILDGKKFRNRDLTLVLSKKSHKDNETYMKKLVEETETKKALAHEKINLIKNHYETLKRSQHVHGMVSIATIYLFFFTKMSPSMLMVGMFCSVAADCLIKNMINLIGYFVKQKNASLKVVYSNVELNEFCNNQ